MIPRPHRAGPSRWRERLGDGVHRRADQRDVQTDIAGEPVDTSTCVGTTVECWGTSRTSSNVSAVVIPVSISGIVSVGVLTSIRLLLRDISCISAVAHGQGSFRPTLGSSRRTVLITSSPPTRAGRGPGPPASARRPPSSAPASRAPRMRGSPPRPGCSSSSGSAAGAVPPGRPRSARAQPERWDHLFFDAPFMSWNSA